MPFNKFTTKPIMQRLQSEIAKVNAPIKIIKNNVALKWCTHANNRQRHCGSVHYRFIYAPR
jgi:hypothetical protein